MARTNVQTAGRTTARPLARAGVAALALIVAAAAALVPEVALAADRSLERSGDWQLITWVTVLATGALFLIAGIGYLYRRERNLDWEFQKPDAPHDDHH
jgi:hypothetical protein